MQSTPLKFGVVWILHPKVCEIGFYTLKFGSVSKTPPSISLSYYVTCWCADMFIFFCAKLTLLFSPQISSTKQHGFKAKSTVNPPRIPSFMTTPFWKQLNSQIIQLKTTKPINPYLLKDPMNPCSLKPNPALGSL